MYNPYPNYYDNNYEPGFNGENEGNFNENNGGSSSNCPVGQVCTSVAGGRDVQSRFNDWDLERFQRFQPWFQRRRWMNRF